MKSVISYLRYRVRNGDALKRFAPTKSINSYARYRVWNYIIDAIFYSTNNSCLILIEQANIIILEICWVTNEKTYIATTKSVISDISYRVRNSDALKRIAVTKGSISYACYRVWNSDALKRFARAKSFISYALYRVRNSDALKRFAVTKGVISYAFYRVRNGDALKRIALFKSVISYACYRVWNGDALKRFTRTKSSISYVGNWVRNYIIDAIFYSTNNSCLILIEQANIIILEICWVTNEKTYIATTKSVISYALYRVRNSDALKRFAATKGFISYARYRVRNGDALKRFAATKCIGTYFFWSIIYIKNRFPINNSTINNSKIRRI